jgi:hypothetical protein
MYEKYNVKNIIFYKGIPYKDKEFLDEINEK